MKLFFIILALSIPCAVFGQDSKFTGIGIFKIGADTSVLYDFAQQQRIKIKKMDEMYDILQARTGYSRKGGIFQLLHNSNNSKDDMTLSYCSDNREYYLSQYEIAGITIKNVILTFFKNRLIKFKCSFDSKIEDAMDAKYGKSESKITNDTVSCVYNMTGVTRKLVAETFINKWKNGDITAESTLKEYYDDHCNKKYVSLFYYEISDREAAQCDSNSLHAHLNSEKPKIDKDKIKDF